MTSQKQKRERFSIKHTRKAKRFAVVLREQREAFPCFAQEIDQLIDRIFVDAERTRKTDRLKVVKCLQEWTEGLSKAEIMEDTGLSEWDVRQLLSDLIAKGKVTERAEERIGLPPAAWRRIYQLNG